ncbi:MORN repeat-containing protein 1 isoform X3 [Amblyraja radiata]|uniref:MORN repeat-containing protein 1 isoform X3 n=1 Tax=Amblyraja radiata TaxID=386614 RepID=UPI00140376FB|nr:MORN repeat-containing protein 1 isoform X3 [Amblyraja radiata]
MAVPAASGCYVGGVRRQLRDGFGRYTYPNSFFKYEGEWKDGKKHGHGKFLMKDGSYYEGELVNGEIEGNGVRYWASSGNEYCGQFSQGEVHGYGVMKYFDGTLYEGEFNYGARAGHGALTDKQGQIYRGAFHNHMKHGEGELFYKNGDHYQGDWVVDRQQGHGVMKYADGSLYEGQWRNGLFNGQGSIIHCSGMVYDGMWINGRPATENGRLLQIWAGVKHIQLSPNFSTTSLELPEDTEEPLIETPYGYNAISYPLVEYVPDLDKIASTESEIMKIKDIEGSGSNLDFGAATGSANRSLNGTPDPSLDNNGKGTPQQEEGVVSEEEDSAPVPIIQRAERGYAAFRNIELAPPSHCYRPFMILDELEKKASKKSNSKTLSEKGTESQEKITESRSDVSIKIDRKPKSGTELPSIRLGEYVIMVTDMTSPPFLGRTLPTAFKLLKVVPQKPSKTGARKEPHKVLSK